MLQNANKSPFWLKKKKHECMIKNNCGFELGFIYI